MYIEIIGLAGFSFVLRVLFALFESTDEWFHLAAIRRIRDQGFTYRDKTAIPRGETGYPIFHHWIISLFPISVWRSIGIILNASYDCVAIVLIYLLVKIYGGEIVVGSDVVDMSQYALLVGAVFSTSPILFPNTSRLKTFGGRTLGGLLSLLHFTCFGIGFLYGWPLAYAGAMISGVLAVASSQFATQNIVWVSLVLSVYYFDLRPIGVLIATGAVAYLLPKLDLGAVARFMIDHYRWYARNYSGTLVENRNKWHDVVSLPRYLVSNPTMFLKTVTLNNSFIVVAYSVPGIWLLGYICLVEPVRFWSVTEEPVVRYSLGITLAAVSSFVLTSFRPFLIFGQAERYFEYSAPFLAYLTVLFGAASEWSHTEWGILIGGQLGVVCGMLVMLAVARLSRSSSEGDKESFFELLGFLDSQEEAHKLVAVPVKLGMKVQASCRNDRLAYYQHFVTNGQGGFGYMAEDLAKYNWPREDWEHFKRRYDIDLVVVSKDDLAIGEKMGVVYERLPKVAVFENEKYSVYRL